MSEEQKIEYEALKKRNAELELALKVKADAGEVKAEESKPNPLDTIGNVNLGNAGLVEVLKTVLKDQEEKDKQAKSAAMEKETLVAQMKIMENRMSRLYEHVTTVSNVKPERKWS